jgi:hypothetical protein
MEALPGLWSLTPIGALIGVVVLAYWLLAGGKIIPRATHERELAAANKRGDEWKETALDGRRIIAAQEQQIRALLESNRIADHFFNTAAKAGDADVG